MDEKLSIYDLILIRDSLRDSAGYMTREWDPIQEDYVRLINYFTERIKKEAQQQ